MQVPGIAQPLQDLCQVSDPSRSVQSNALLDSKLMA